MTKPVVLCILDGWGLSETPETSAPDQAQTPHMDRLFATCPHATLITHGPDVGLPKGQMGNSEVGHMNIGAGRVVAMDLGQIDLAIEEGRFAQEASLQAWIRALKESGGTAHLMGVVSDGGVHGHLEHMIAAAEAITAAGVPVAIHAITDGRDVPPGSAADYLTALEDRLPKSAKVATVIGRYWAMDRDLRWERIEKAYRAMALGEGIAVETALAAITENDEFIEPHIVAGYQGMSEGDGFFCLNFRADRAREILTALGDPSLDAFATSHPRLNLLGMVDYSEAHNAFMQTVYPKKQVENTLASWVAQHGLKQFHVAETEKYPHVTFFLNGGKEAPEEGEERVMPNSPKVATYDLAPEMSAAEVTDQLVAAIEAQYDLIVVNYANPDMVGHTGDLKAASLACEAVDAGLGQALDALEKVGGAMVVCADHGNCEMMVDPETGGPHTAHTLNPVPVILVGGAEDASLRDGRLADLAPTILALMGLTPPVEMTGRSLIQ